MLFRPMLSWSGTGKLSANGIGHNEKRCLHERHALWGSGPQGINLHFGDEAHRSNNGSIWVELLSKYWQDEYGYEYGRCRVVDLTDKDGAHDPVNKDLLRRLRLPFVCWTFIQCRCRP